MSALTVYQGLEERFRTIAGLRTIQLGEPSGDMDLPGLYTAYGEFDHPLRSSPPARNVSGTTHQFVARLVIRWQDFQAAEMQLITLIDAIPAAIDADPHLGSRLSKGMAWCPAGITGFAKISGIEYRIVDYTIRCLEKQEGT